MEGEDPIAASSPTNTGSSAGPGSGLDAAVLAHREQIADVLSAIEEDRDPQITGEEARKAVEIVLAVYRSATQNTPVTLPLRTDLDPPLGL